MQANIFWASSTKSVPVKSSHRIAATTFQFSSKNIRRHKERLGVSIRKTLAKETIMPIRAEYVHTNLIARDWKKLVRFYSDVFGCDPKPPERDMSGAWLDQLTSLQDAHLSGVHLRLPGYGDDGPTLEIFSYNQLVEGELQSANQCGFGHIAFAVEDVGEALQAVIAAGGSTVGNIVTTEVDGVGVLRVVYARDPEGNIVELQKWS
jgi:predicted enzyme related to lactoylglutathione lyase